MFGELAKHNSSLTLFVHVHHIPSQTDQPNFSHMPLVASVDALHMFLSLDPCPQKTGIGHHVSGHADLSGSVSHPPTTVVSVPLGHLSLVS